jgi:phage baseplate assembly protein V
MTPPFAPRFEVRLSGVTMAADLAANVTSLSVETDLDLAGTFALTLRNADNTLLDSPLLDLGKTVEIHLGYGRDLVPAFLGEVAAIEPAFPADGPPTVRVTGYDKSYRMRRSQPEPTTYTMTNDSLIAARIAAENGLIPVVDPTPGIPERVVQTEPDFAFLRSRAEQYFFDVYVEWDRLHFQLPRPQLAAHVLEWGRNLGSFSPRISAAGLAGLQVIRSYDQELAQSITVAALAGDLGVDSLVERLGSSAMDLLGSLVRAGVRKGSVGNPLHAAVLAKALLQNLLEGLYEGSGSCIGIPDLTAGRFVAIRGVGRRFSGTYRVRRVAHHIDGNGFSTDFSISQRGHTSLLGLLREKAVKEPAPDEPQRFFGVVLGKVVDNNESRAVPPVIPSGKVQVTYPGLSEKITSGWAPVVRPMAGSNAGFYAVPDVGDQVLVAFEHGDLSQPYVLGALWNAKARPPGDNLDGRNSKRVLRSSAGHTITFDDAAPSPTLTVTDSAGSAVTFDPSKRSLTVHAAQDLTLSANGNISIQALNGTTKLDLTSSGVNVT